MLKTKYKSIKVAAFLLALAPLVASPRSAVLFGEPQLPKRMMK